MGKGGRKAWCGGIVSLASACGLASCFPPVEPAWVITSPRLVSFEITVVETGDLARPLEEDPDDRERAEPMPGDAVALNAVVVGPQGALPLPDDALWFNCRNGVSCEGMFAEDVVPCDAVAPLLAEPNVTCLLGRHDEQPFSIRPVVPSFLPGLTDSYVIVVASTSASRSSEACRAALGARRESADSLFDCVTAGSLVGVGPTFILAREIEELGGGTAIPVGNAPSEAFDVEPDLRPVPRIYALREQDGEDTEIELDHGATLDLEVGEHARVWVELEERDIQEYWIPSDPPSVELERPSWTLTSTAFLDGPPSDATGTFDWQVQDTDDGATLVFSSSASVDRNELATWIRLRVAEP